MIGRSPTGEGIGKRRLRAGYLSHFSAKPAPRLGSDDGPTVDVAHVDSNPDHQKILHLLRQLPENRNSQQVFACPKSASAHPL